jgi:oligopeptide transport system substrate-binding protein
MKTTTLFLATLGVLICCEFGLAQLNSVALPTVVKTGNKAFVYPANEKKVLRIPILTGMKTLDPAAAVTSQEKSVCAQIYEPLLQYEYLVRPTELAPCLLESMPTVSADGITYRFKLKPGIRFHDDECFPNGIGRKVEPDDVFYSWKRLADTSVSTNWWLVDNMIEGFNDYRSEQRSLEAFDYTAPVAGMRAINDREFEVQLVEPHSRFLHVLAMVQTALVPREAVEKYGAAFKYKPIGTGPFAIDGLPAAGVRLNRNPNYHVDKYPARCMSTDLKNGLDKPGGARTPICDRLEFVLFNDDRTQWKEFRQRKIDFTTVPFDAYDEVFQRRSNLILPQLADKQIVLHADHFLDFIFIGFNMEDEVFGGYTDKKKALRQAMSLALDWEQKNSIFYQGKAYVYDGPIPLGIAGHPKGGKSQSSYRGPNIERAKLLMAKAGHPDGDGLEPIELWLGKGGNAREQGELTKRHLAAIGIDVHVNVVDFTALIQRVDEKKAQLFSFAWGSDYPDAENNLSLFYGLNQPRGANHFIYKNPDYDKLYERIIRMQPSPERDIICEKMRDIVIEDVPCLGGMARRQFYLTHPRLKNFKPTETLFSWYKYLDDSKH